MSGSVYNLQIAVDGGDDERGEEILAALQAAGKPVQNLGGVFREVVYMDFEDRASALQALEHDLTRAGQDWREHLMIS